MYTTFLKTNQSIKFDKPLPSLQSFVNNFRTASDYKLSACLIEKSMSSVLASIICFLHAKDDYLKANNTVLCGGWHCKYVIKKICYGFSLLYLYSMFINFTILATVIIQIMDINYWKKW